jgi:hypothetical protein
MKIGRTWANLRRAVAILLHHEDTSCMLQLIASKVINMQEAVLAQLKTVLDEVSLAASPVFDTAASLDDRGNVLARQTDMARECTQHLVEAVESCLLAQDQCRECTGHGSARAQGNLRKRCSMDAASNGPVKPTAGGSARQGNGRRAQHH